MQLAYKDTHLEPDYVTSDNYSNALNEVSNHMDKGSSYIDVLRVVLFLLPSQSLLQETESTVVFLTLLYIMTPFVNFCFLHIFTVRLPAMTVTVSPSPVTVTMSVTEYCTHAEWEMENLDNTKVNASG